MEGDSFLTYSRKHVHFYDKEISLVLQKGLTLSHGISRKTKIVDLGCGDGKLIFALHERGLLRNSGQVVGVDVSKERIERLTNELPFVIGLVSDALEVELPDSSFDFVICSQLIEHIENDTGLLRKVKQLLRKKGLVYISSVIKKMYGVYFYHREASFRLDPTHIREYSSASEFLGLLKSEGFEVVDFEIHQIMFPLTDLIVRLLVRIGFLDPNVRFYEQHRVFGELRRFRIPVIGYTSIEVLAEKNE